MSANIEDNQYDRLSNTFEKIMVKYLGASKPHKHYMSAYADYYGEPFAARSLLFAVCVKEITSNGSAYTEDDLEEMGEFLTNFSDEYDDENVYIAINNCMNFFESKL